MEEWSAIRGFSGYEVSSEGRVRSRRRKMPRILKGSLHRDGYRLVTLQGPDGSTQRYVHQLVLEAFVGPRGDGQETRHLNGNKNDNCVENLMWGTHKENGRDRIEHNLQGVLRERHPRGVPHGVGRQLRGEEKSQARITESDVRVIRTSSKKLRELAVEYGLSVSQICAIRKQTRWAHVK